MLYSHCCCQYPSNKGLPGNIPIGSTRHAKSTIVRTNTHVEAQLEGRAMFVKLTETDVWTLDPSSRLEKERSAVSEKVVFETCLTASLALAANPRPRPSCGVELRVNLTLVPADQASRLTCCCVRYDGCPSLCIGCVQGHLCIYPTANC